MECFMPEGGGGGNILFGSTRGENYRLVSEMKKKFAEKEKNIAPPVYRMLRALPRKLMRLSASRSSGHDAQ